MDMETKIFEFKIDDLDEEGKFSGYLSTFGNVDEGGDLVEKGAFKKTLRDTKGFPLIIQHQPYLPSLAVGSFNGEEDNKGLKINGEYFLDIEEGQKAYLGTKRLLKNKVRVGLSMGYKTIRKEDDEIDGIPVRRLKEVKLYEGSLTLFPMNTFAGIESIKEEGREEDIEGKPSRNNHTCRLNSGDYSRYRSEKRKHNGKPYTVRFGIRKNDGKAEEYEYFYPIDSWTASEARSHCKEHEGKFETAIKEDDFLKAISNSFSETCDKTLNPEPSSDTRKTEPSSKGEPDPFHSALREVIKGLKNKKGENNE